MLSCIYGRERLAILIGVQDFREIREGGYYYVDKSELISDIVAQKAKVYLFTRRGGSGSR